TDVESVAEEDACERRSDDAPHASALDGYRGMLARRAAAEVLRCHNDIARLNFLGKLGIEAFQAMSAQLHRVDGSQIPHRDDNVGVHVGAELPGATLKVHRS